MTAEQKKQQTVAALIIASDLAIVLHFMLLKNFKTKMYSKHEVLTWF